MPRFARKRPAYRRRPARKRRYVKKSKYVRKLKGTNTQINIKQRNVTAIAVTTPDLERTRPVTMETFSLTGVPRYMDFKNMFDKYMINGVKVNMQIMGDTSSSLKDGLSLVYRIDKDGRSIWDKASVGTMLGSSSARTVNFNQNKTQHSIFLRPKTVSPVYTGVASGAIPTPNPPGWKENPKQWLDTNSPTILHYGLEYGFMNATSNVDTAVEIQITYTYYLSFKSIVTPFEPPPVAVIRDQYLPATRDVSGNIPPVEHNTPATDALWTWLENQFEGRFSTDASGNYIIPKHEATATTAPEFQ